MASVHTKLTNGSVRFLRFAKQNLSALVPALAFTLVIAMTPYFSQLVIADCLAQQQKINLLLCTDNKALQAIAEYFEGPVDVQEDAEVRAGGPEVDSRALSELEDQDQVTGDGERIDPRAPAMKSAAREASKRTAWGAAVAIFVFSGMAGIAGAVVVINFSLRMVNYSSIYVIFIIISPFFTAGLFFLLDQAIVPLLFANTLTLASLEGWYLFFPTNLLSFLDKRMPIIFNVFFLENAIFVVMAGLIVTACIALLLNDDVNSNDADGDLDSARSLAKRMRWLRTLLYLSALVLVAAVYHVHALYDWPSGSQPMRTWSMLLKSLPGRSPSGSVRCSASFSLPCSSLLR